MLNEGNKVIKNYTLNMLYEVFLLIIPILVTPYVARVLGEEGSGQYSYTFSVASYFVLFAALGFNLYGQRLIASHQGDGRQQSIDFWEVVSARIIPCIVTILVYVVTVTVGLYGHRYDLLMSILTINIIAVIFDINFYFQGNEEFGKIVTRSIIIKSLSIVCIFAFVKEQGDLWKYALIQSLAILLSNIVIWVYMSSYLKKVSLNDLHPIKHLKPVLILFVPTIALSVYTTLDKTMIGIITQLDSENGNYEYAEKLVKMVLTILTSLGTVLSPRNAKRFAEGDKAGVQKNILHTCRFVFFLGVPLMFGIIAVADNLIPWYLGTGYKKAAMLMKILAPLVIIIGLSNVFGRQFLIPSKQDKRFTIAIICGAATNLVLNIVLIRALASYGAAIATVIAELVVTLVMLLFIRTSVDFGKIMQESWRYWIAGIVMFIICFLIQNNLSPSIIHTLVIVVVGSMAYFAGVLLLRDSFVLGLINSMRGGK